ncbi:MAG: CoA-transferase, partial [Smithellaceae bacterium]
MDVIEQGVGELFTDPDADNARAVFRQKSRAMQNKVMSVKEAVERFVHDGEYLAFGGFGCNRIPAAAAHEIVRQGKKNMGFAG